ncbi:MAG: hypothetical protein ACE14T_10860 [Syntrophales bacterium]
MIIDKCPWTDFAVSLVKQAAKSASFCLLLLVISCAPSLYSIDLKYEPSAHTRAESAETKETVSVASFVDARRTADPLMIGKVVILDGREIPVFPKHEKPSDAVASSLREFLFKSGYTVSSGKPSWDLREETIQKKWGKILVGGKIEEFDITCRESVPVKKYTAKVRLTVILADTERGRIFFRTTTESSSSLEHIIFSEEKLEQQMNAALSDAIEKSFDGQEIKQKIRATAQ